MNLRRDASLALVSHECLSACREILYPCCVDDSPENNLRGFCLSDVVGVRNLSQLCHSTFSDFLHITCEKRRLRGWVSSVGLQVICHMPPSRGRGRQQQLTINPLLHNFIHSSNAKKICGGREVVSHVARDLPRAALSRRHVYTPTHAHTQRQLKPQRTTSNS